MSFKDIPIIELKTKSHNQEIKRTLNVDKRKVQQALEWLKQNNSLYKEITVSNSQVQNLTTDREMNVCVTQKESNENTLPEVGLGLGY